MKKQRVLLDFEGIMPALTIKSRKNQAGWKPALRHCCAKRMRQECCHTTGLLHELHHRLYARMHVELLIYVF